jgi:hypothetical protein
MGMLETTDFVVIYFIVYFAMITALMSVFYMVYRFGMPKAKKILQNDIPHYIDSQVDRTIQSAVPKIMRKISNMDRSIKGNKAQNTQPSGGIIETVMNNPAVKEGIGNMVGGFIGNMFKPSGPK